MTRTKPAPKRAAVIKAVYALAFLELAVLLVLMVQFAAGPGTASSSGGAEMGMFFFVQLPFGVLCTALAAFHFVRWRMVRIAAALVLAAPLLGLAWWAADEVSYRMSRREAPLAHDETTKSEALALRAAILEGNAERVAATAAATDVNDTFGGEATFLSLAMTRTDIDLAIVQTLLKAGADPNQHGGWPLGVAVGRNNAPLATLLLDAGANPNQPGGFGSPVFFSALDKPEMLALLLQRGARVDAESSNGETALMRAAWNQAWPVVPLLLQAGADVGHVSADGAGIAKSIAFVRYRTGVTGQPIPSELLELENRLRKRGAEQAR